MSHVACVARCSLHDGAEINGSKHAAGSGAMSADEQREVARSIGLGGIKYAPGAGLQKRPDRYR